MLIYIANRHHGTPPLNITNKHMRCGTCHLHEAIYHMYPLCSVHGIRGVR